MSTLTTPLHTSYFESERGFGERHEQTFPLIRAALGAVLLGAPWAFGAVETWCWALAAFVLGLTLILSSISCARSDWVDLVWSPVYIPVAAFLLLGLFQLAAQKTADRISTRNALVELAACGALFFLVSQLAARLQHDAWRGFGLAVLAYTFCMTMYAIIQYLSSPKRLYWLVRPHSKSWIFGPYVNHNHYAGLMEMLIPLSAGYVLSHRPHHLKPLLGFAVLVPISSVLLSGSRGGVVALFLEAVVFIAVLLLEAPKGRRVRKSVGVTLAVAIAFVGFLWMQPGGLVKRLETVLEPSHSADVSFRDRKQVTLDSLRMFRNHLWLGTGLGAFEYAYPHYQTLPGDAVWDHAHDDYVELLAETGLAGGTLALMTVVIWFRLAFRDLRERLEHGAGWIQLGAAVGCCGLLSHSLVDFNLHIPANALWFAACAGIAISTYTVPQAVECRSRHESDHKNV